MSINSNSTNLQLDTKRHSFAHLMAAAVGQMFLEVQYGVGPVIETGCYYDFVLPRNLVPEDLPLLENHIKDMLKRDLRFKVQELSLEEAILHFNNAKQPLKVELLENLRDRGTTSMSEEEKADFGDENYSELFEIVKTRNLRRINVGLVITNYNGEILFAKRSSNKKSRPSLWHIPGGKMEEGENFEQAIKRELKEELNLDLVKIKSFTNCTWNMFGVETGNNADEDTYYFEIEAKGEVTLNYENTEYAYFDIDTAKNLDGITKPELELFKNINKSNLPPITIYRIVDEKTGEVVFEDLCKGPHVAGVRRINTQNNEKAEVSNSPLEGWQPKVDGVFESMTTSEKFIKYQQLPYNPKLTEKAAELRKAGNLSEVLFWEQVKNGKLLDLDFERQKIVGNYIVDFYCPELGLVVEIDGESHDFKDEYDVQRENYLVSLGLKVVHFADVEIKKAMDQVLESVYGLCKKLKETPRQPTVATPHEGNYPPQLSSNIQEGNYDTAKGQGISIELKQTIETYNNNLDKYIAKTNFVVDGIKKDWIDKTLQKLNKDSTILEIGSGLGIDADYIESNGFRVDRTDYSQSFIDHQKSQGKEIGQYNVLSKPTKKQYDLVFADAVLLHFNDQEFGDALVNINQSLHENGLFAFSLKKGEGASMIVDKMESPRYFKLWQKNELVNALSKKGFESQEILEGDNWLMVIAKKIDRIKPPESLNLQNMGFKLDKFSASYWRGDQARGINMQRLYALVFETKDELKAFVTQREEAKKRDHRVLGQQMKLFTISEMVGAGLTLMQPKGTIIRNLLQQYLWQIHKPHGYQQLWTPHIAKEELYIRSGHAGHYMDDMFSVYGGTSKEKFYLKPMNCPHHMQVFADNQFSYRDMPVRYFEPATVYRDEKTGQLSGLARVRNITQDDGHVFCRINGIQEEVTIFANAVKEFYATMGMQADWVSLSVRDATDRSKYLGTDQNWDIAEKALEDAAKANGFNYKRVEGEAAFYGPKLDFMFKDCLGRQWQLSTIQCDFNLPERFDLSFKNEDGNEERPVVLHRAVAGSYERFMGIMIENYAGKFPFWLAPEQIRILTINDEVLPYADKIKAELDQVVLMQPLKYNELRYSVDTRMESLGKKIRDSKLDKVPMFIVVGMKDVEEGIVSIEYAGESVKVPLAEVKTWMESVK